MVADIAGRVLGGLVIEGLKAVRDLMVGGVKGGFFDEGLILRKAIDEFDVLVDGGGVLVEAREGWDEPSAELGDESLLVGGLSFLDGVERRLVEVGEFAVEALLGVRVGLGG